MVLYISRSAFGSTDYVTTSIEPLTSRMKEILKSPEYSFVDRIVPGQTKLKAVNEHKIDVKKTEHPGKEDYKALVDIKSKDSSKIISMAKELKGLYQAFIKVAENAPVGIYTPTSLNALHRYYRVLIGNTDIVINYFSK